MCARVRAEGTDFGQSNFRSRHGAPKSAQTQNRARRVGPVGWGPKIRAFFPSLASIFALFVSLWVSSCGILVVFEWILFLFFLWKELKFVP